MLRLDVDLSLAAKVEKGGFGPLFCLWMLWLDVDLSLAAK